MLTLLNLSASLSDINKMTFQYICRTLIPTNLGYGHFCQTAHCQHQNCSKCPLYTNSKEDDIRATKEAGEKVAKEIAENTAQGVNVDVDALLKNADKASPRRNGYPAMPAPPPPPPPPPAAAAAAVGIIAGPPPGAAAAAPYYPPGLPVGVAGIPAVVYYPVGAVGGPPPGMGGGRRRRRRRR